MNRPLFEIAKEIRADWTKKSKSGIYFGAVPYLDAMATLNSMKDMYICDDAKTIVLYFLANAKTWKGDVAHRIKTELKGMCK